MIYLSKNPNNPMVNVKLPKVKDIFARVGFRTISGCTTGDVNPLPQRKSDVVDQINKEADAAAAKEAAAAAEKAAAASE